MLSLSCKAAIKAVVYLGSKYDGEQKSSIREISEFINENEHTIGKLLQKLVKVKIINSSKGPNGGFYITKLQIEQPIITIVEVVDGKDVFERCALGLSKCNEARPCPLHDDFKPIRNKFRQMCQEKRIKDLHELVNSGLSFLIG